MPETPRGYRRGRERPQALVLGILLLSTPGCLWEADRENAPDPLPDIYLIVVDTLRADHLPTYGYDRDTSPALDAFAAQGVRFDVDG